MVPITIISETLFDVAHSFVHRHQKMLELHALLCKLQQQRWLLTFRHGLDPCTPQLVACHHGNVQGEVVPQMVQMGGRGDIASAKLDKKKKKQAERHLQKV